MPSLEEVSRLHDELTRGAPVLERPLADGVAGRFPAEEVDMQDWRDMLKRSQELRLKLRKRLNQRAARCSAPAVAEERQEESCETLREKREAQRHRLAGADRERALRGGGAARQQEDR